MPKKTIAILGAGPGLGNHIGLEFGRRGFDVVLLARRGDALRGYVEEFAREGIEADCQVVDCADNDSIVHALAEVLERHGAIDVLEYNAAVLGGGRPTELAPEEFARRHQVDVLGAICAVQQVVPAMRERGDGAILLTGGGLALDPEPQYASISMDKAALRALAIALHKALAPDGVFCGIVNVVGMIGSDEHYSPANVAKNFWQLYEERDGMEITY